MFILVYDSLFFLSYKGPPLFMQNKINDFNATKFLSYYRYDLTIGTSDKGTPLEDLPENDVKYNHSLIVFGGLHGIEAALESDEHLQVEEASLLFNHYVNVLPNQGSRTIRTEEAILIAMSSLRTKLKANNEPMVFKDTGIAVSSSFPQADMNKNDNSDFSRFD